MGALAGATLRRRGVTDIVVANRSAERGARLAAFARRPRGRAGRDHRRDRRRRPARSAPPEPPGSWSRVSAIGDRSARPLVVLDVALPRDVDPAVATLPGVTYVDLDSLRADGAMVSDAEIAAASAVIADELADLPRPAAGARRRPDRHRAARPGQPGRRRRTRPTRRPAARPRPVRAQRGGRRRAPSRREGAARADGPGEGTRRRHRAATSTRRRCASCSTSTRPARVRHRRQPTTESRAMTVYPHAARGHPRLAAGAHPDRPGCRLRSASRSRSCTSSPRATARPRRSTRSAAPACSSRRCVRPCWPARSTSPSTPTRTCRPRRPRASSSPRCRSARIRATRSSPATG